MDLCRKTAGIQNKLESVRQDLQGKARRPGLTLEGQLGDNGFTSNGTIRVDDINQGYVGCLGDRDTHWCRGSIVCISEEA